MKIERKRGIKKIRITHNKKLFWVIIILLILLAILIYFIIKNAKKTEEKPGISNMECYSNVDCAASSCCHAESCVSKDKAPECKGIFCTQVCSGPLDCGAGHCGCVEGRCIIVKD